MRTLSRLAVTICIGIPATLALIVALTVYCTFHYVIFATFAAHRAGLQKM